MDVTTVKRRAARGAVYLALRTAVVQLTILGGTVILARALSPTDFGVYAILRFALTFFEFFGDAGIAGALIRKESPPTRDELSNVFTLQCALATVVVVIVWLLAPVVVMVWPDLPADSIWLLRAMSIAFLLTGARVVPAVLMERSLRFGEIAILEVFGTVSFFGVASACALLGYGTWSWVSAMLAQGVIALVGAYVVNPWRPRLALDWKLVRPLVAFGVPYQAKNLIGFVNSAAAPLYAGSVLGATRLGFINWGQNTAFFPLKVVEVMSRVSFPLFSRFQHDQKLLKRSLERSLQICSLGTFFCVALFTAMGPNVTLVVFTEKWLPALPALYAYSWVLCIGFVSPVVGAALDAIGRPGIIVRLAIYWTALNWLVVPFATHRYGMIGFVLGNCVHIVVGNAAVIFVVARLMPGLRIVRPLLPPLAGALGAFVIAWFWARHWAWSGASLTAAVVLMLAANLAIVALIDRHAVRDAVGLFRPAQKLASTAE
jgi:PST family polysaccharide transporter